MRIGPKLLKYSNTTARLKGIETCSIDDKQHRRGDSNTTARLKGIETGAYDLRRADDRHSNTTARLKGIETRRHWRAAEGNKQQHNCPLKGH